MEYVGTPSATQLLAMSEVQLQNNVLKLATLGRWLAYHTHDSRRSQAGFPDLVLVRGRELLYRELKTEKGRVSKDQAKWLAALEAASADVGIWRPRDLQAIATRLTASSPTLAESVLQDLDDLSVLD